MLLHLTTNNIRKKSKIGEIEKYTTVYDILKFVVETFDFLHVYANPDDRAKFTQIIHHWDQR